MRNEINAATIDMKSILGEDVDYDKLAESVKLGMQQHFNISFKSLSEEIDSAVLMN